MGSKQLDIGIVDGEVHHTHLPMEAFADDLMYIVAASNNPFVKQNPQKIAYLKNENWLVREETSGTREVTEKMLSELTFIQKTLWNLAARRSLRNLRKPV